MSNKLIVALDGMTFDSAIDLAHLLRDHVWGFKVNDLLIEYGVQLIRRLREYGHVFADPKLYDIPNTVTNQVTKLVQAGADLITVHASGGPTMLEAATVVGDGRILAVTVLTSFTGEDLATIYNRDRTALVSGFATLAGRAGCRGVICAATDIEGVRQLDLGLLAVMPGYRPAGKFAGDDQQVIGDSRLARLADLVVVGRPVTQAVDPVQVVVRMNTDLAG